MEEINLLARKSFGVPRPFWAEPMAIMLIQMEAGQNLWPKIMRRYPRPYNLNLSSAQRHSQIPLSIRTFLPH